MVLDRLCQYHLYMKLLKCEFHTTTVDFLGFVISPHGISMEPTRVETIMKWPEPYCIFDVQQFLGFANFYHRFIEKYSQITAPLSDLTKGEGSQKGANKKTAGFIFTPKAKAAFEAIKQQFTTAPLLAYYDLNLEIHIKPDASGYAIAGVRAPGAFLYIVPHKGCLQCLAVVMPGHPSSQARRLLEHPSSQTG